MHAREKPLFLAKFAGKTNFLEMFFLIVCPRVIEKTCGGCSATGKIFDIDTDRKFITSHKNKIDYLTPK
jgi:hypothetical protein